MGMELAEYLKAHGLTQAEFAELVGRTPGAVSHWITKRQTVSPHSAWLIERATSGAVKAADLRPDVFGQ